MNPAFARISLGLLALASLQTAACGGDSDPTTVDPGDGSTAGPDVVADETDEDTVDPDAADVSEPETSDPDVLDDADVDVDDADVGEDVAEDVEVDTFDPDFWRDLEPCVPVVTEASQLQAGEMEGSAVMSPGGRALVSAGVTIDLPGFPANLVFSSDEELAYVLSTSNDDRRVLVVQVSDGTVVQNVELPEAFQGIALDEARGQLYVSGGGERQLHALAVDPDDGTLSNRRTFDMPTYPTDLLLLPDGSRLLVGSFTPGDFSDPNYPGGPFYNLGARDADRAQYVVDQMNTNGLARFTYVLMPNDHTGGVTPGNPTPEAQVADNDYGVGLLVEGLSNSPYWENTVIFVLEDDPQGCTDHVDSHRSFLFAISPWAKRNHVSHVNTNYQSVFATITRIIGVPPMGRPDASSAPLWDLFTATPDFTPWTAVPREIPESKIRSADVPGAQESMRMDFRGPDRNEDLGIVLDNYRLWQMGRITEQEARDRIARGIESRPAIGSLGDDDFEEAAEERHEEAEEEVFSFDLEYERYVEWARSRGRTVAPLTGGPMDEDTIRAINAGRIDLQRFDRFAPAPLPVLPVTP